jgi:NosR/NirI family nitrous oxide reductase transcriptional regulator
LCSNNCEMGLNLYKVESVCGGDCINCFKCIETCPRNNIKVNVLGENINPEFASSLVLAAMVGLYTVNSLGGTALAQSQIATSSSTSVSTSINNDSQKYTDGTYTGTGTGFRGATTEMSVTIKDNVITNVETVSHGDTQRFYEGVESSMISGIMSAQLTTVDTISGSTYSCNGIIDAVQDALEQAQISSSSSAASSSNSDDSTTTNESASTDENSTITYESNAENAATSDGLESATSSYDSAITMSEGSYTDGTYTGSGTGFRNGTTQMSVTIKNNVITNVAQVSNEDTPNINSINISRYDFGSYI